MINSGEAAENYKFHKVWLHKFKNMFLFIFYFVTPFMQAPAWCIRYYKQQDDRGPMFDCDAVDGGIIPTSRIPKFAPAIICSVDLVCLSYLMFSVWFKSQWKV